MIRRPPRSTRTDTLIPSTTLFRSLIVGLAGPIRLSLGDPAENHRAVRTRRQGKRLHSPASGPWPVWKAFYVAVLSDPGHARDVALHNAVARFAAIDSGQYRTERARVHARVDAEIGRAHV